MQQNFIVIFYFINLTATHNEISRYSSEEISGNESNEVTSMTESERQAEINRQKEEMKLKRRKKKRTSSSMQSSTFKGKNHYPQISIVIFFFRIVFFPDWSFFLSSICAQILVIHTIVVTAVNFTHVVPLYGKIKWIRKSVRKNVVSYITKL